MMLYMKLIVLLETYRLENKLIQQLAENLDVSFATVNRWFNGKAKQNSNISYNKIIKD